MSMFQCEHCGCAENTAFTFSLVHNSYWNKDFNWEGIEDRRGKRLCSACMPQWYLGGSSTLYTGLWHGRFERIYLPLGMFTTDKQGNLVHRESGDTDYRKYRIYKE